MGTSLLPVLHETTVTPGPRPCLEMNQKFSCLPKNRISSYVELTDGFSRLAVALGASGGPERRDLEIVTPTSGREVRNGCWADSRRRYDAASGIKTLADLGAVVAFEERRGRLTVSVFAIVPTIVRRRRAPSSRRSTS